MTPPDLARFTAVGIVVVAGDEAVWLNDSARALVEPFGATWTGPDSPVRSLAGVRPGSQRVPFRWPPPVGDTRWWQVASTPIGDGAEILYEITDETARYDADGRDLGPPTAQWRLSRLEAMAGTGSYVWNILEDSITWSEALLVRFRLPPTAEMPLADYLAMLHPEDVEPTERVLRRALADHRPFHYTHRITVADSPTPRVFECYGEVFCTAAGVATRVMATARDVTEQHRDRKQLEFLADHDPLTRVANRRRINARLVECAATTGCALLLIDVDNFKDVNDLRGHAVGDQVIRQTARTVADRLDRDSVLGRLGGDEFAVVVPDCTATRAMELAERLCDAVATTPMIGGVNALRLTVSIGVTTAARGQDPEVSLARADLALYEAKNAGRNRARLFTPDHYHQAVRRVSILQRVGDALDHGTMGLAAQPIVDLATGRAGRYEVLIRLRDGLTPALGPADFLPAAERTDLVLKLDRWVLERAVRALASAPARAERLRLEVNVSARSLDDDELGAWILHRLKEAEVEPQRLGLEITETAAITSLDAARTLATRLTQAGCGFALDDFGAGFGSFSHLKNLPFTAVKIAGEFVHRLDEDRVDRAMVTAVVGVARRLGMRTVGEHVDRAELVAQLRALGVDDGQGYHLGHPRPLTELAP